MTLPRGSGTEGWGARPPVLTWHGFTEAPGRDPHGVIVTRSALAAQLRLLARRDPAGLDLDGWLARSRGRRGAGVLLTVDDALSSAVDIGLPDMLAAGRRPVLFVCPGHLGGTTTWMTDQPDLPVASQDDVVALARDGVEIGAHAFEHVDLRGLDDAALRRQTTDAADALADLTGRRPRAFAYPFGWWDERAADAVRRAGYEVGFSLYDGRGPWAATRLDVSPPDTPASLRVKMLPGYRKAWRASGHVAPLRRGVRVALSRVGARR